MRHKYETRGIVLARSPLSEANALVTLLVPGLGLVCARTQSLRKPSAKLAAALTTLTESDLVLVRGNEGWRVAGAVLVQHWSARIVRYESRTRAARVCGLLLRLVAGEANDSALYPLMRGFFEALALCPDDMHEAAELLTVLRMLSILGLDAGNLPGEIPIFAPELLGAVRNNRTDYISRINHGIIASGL